jgi:hypothetical protein
MRALAGLLFVAASGCLAISPSDGALHCSTVGAQCPSGYYCADDNTCWHNGKAPSSPPDMAVAGGTDDMMSQNVSCMVPSDCPTPAQPCLVSLCIQSACGLIAAQQGTVPPSIQVAGDCQKRICDASGNPMTVADTTNKPTDATGGCNTPGCNGSTPTMTPTVSGTACTQTASGVCNGAGICGVCKPGTARCMSLTIQNCSTQGQWVNGTVCRNACTNGACSGACNPAMDTPYCTGIDQLNTCVGTAWQVSTCPNACSGTPGACTGTCKPSAKVCSGNNVTWCDATGTPQTQACAACLNGACVDCNPNVVQCCSSNTGHQTCDSTGHWGACASCGGTYWSCSGAGACSCAGAPDPCSPSDQCGVRADACGNAIGCGPNGDGSCTTGTCTYNKVSNYYWCKNTTTTGCTVCPCCGSCCGRYCC